MNKLLDIASPELSPFKASASDSILLHTGERVRELLRLLQIKNGFYAFESALHLFPLQSSEQVIGLDVWNTPHIWIDSYGGLAQECLFFAEDIFGGQFCIKDDQIYSFDPETGALEFLAPDMPSWAHLILEDYEFLTGYPLAHAWQKLHGAIPVGSRLIPRIPFVTGGEYSVDNLYALDAIKGMKVRGEIALQIKDLPDGASIRFSIGE